VNGILTLQTGTPFNLSVPGTIINAPGNSNNPDLVGTYTASKGVGTQTTWFDPSVFRQPAAGTFGSLGRNVLTGPGLGNLDFSIFRKFAVTERFKAEFRVESFNVTNTAKFNTQAATSRARISAKSPERKGLPKVRAKSRWA